MRTLSFRTERFCRKQSEAAEINPGRSGRELISWIESTLKNQGLAPQTAIGEDWGWLLPCQHKGISLIVCCGNEEGSQDRWIVFAVPKPKILQRLFGGRLLRSAVSDLEASLEKAALASGFDQVEWTNERY